jgi:hypothetical protein
MMNAAVAQNFALPASSIATRAAFRVSPSFLSSRFHSLELEIVEIVLDQGADLLVPHASS